MTNDTFLMLDSPDKIAALDGSWFSQIPPSSGSDGRFMKFLITAAYGRLAIISPCRVMLASFSLLAWNCDNFKLNLNSIASQQDRLKHMILGMAISFSMTCTCVFSLR